MLNSRGSQYVFFGGVGFFVIVNITNRFLEIYRPSLFYEIVDTIQAQSVFKCLKKLTSWFSP